MGGTTSLGIRYPFMSEVVDATSWQDMAEDIDALMTSLDTIRDLAVGHPTARITGGTASAASATTTTVTNYSAVTWDTAGYANLGVNPSQLTVPPGIYFVGASILGGSVTTLAMSRLQVITGATVWGGQMVDITGSTSVGISCPATLVYTTAPTTAIQASVRWQGTGGPSLYTFGTLQVMQVRALADV